MCATAPLIWQRVVDVLHPTLLVFLAGPWDLTDHRVGGRRLAAGSPELARRYTERLETLVQVARQGGREGRAAVRDVPGPVRVVDVRGHVCPRGATRPELGGHDITTDGVHLTRSGSRQVWSWLMPRLAAVLTPPAGGQPPDGQSGRSSR